MRTLEELGISPAPWKVGAIAGDDKGLVVFDRNNCAVVLMHELAEYRNADARMIAAAPMLYEALREMLNMYPLDAADNEYVVAVRNMAYAALAAGGESEEAKRKTTEGGKNANA